MNRLSEPLNCPHCASLSQKTILYILDQREQDEEWGEGYIWRLLFCSICNKPLLQRKFDYIDDLSDEIPMFENVFPLSDREPFNRKRVVSGNHNIEGLPLEISEAYESALRVKSDVNAFAVLLGRVLELVCKDKNVEGRSLHNMINALIDEGILPDQLGNIAQSLRKMRNIGAHATLGELSKEEAPILHALCKTILEYVYTGPYLIEQVEKKLDQLK